MLCYAGPTGAQLTVTKAKGLPRITISLDPVAPPAFCDVLADFSLALYAAYRNTHQQAATGSLRSF